MIQFSANKKLVEYKDISDDETVVIFKVLI